MSAWDKDLSERSGSQPLAANALATHLLQLGARGASGRLMLGGRVLVLRQGRLADVLATPQDESLAQQMQRAGRSAAPTGMELRHLQRTLMVERLARALRAGSDGGEGPSTVEHALDAPATSEALPLAPLLLDALARAGASADAGVVGAHLNHRIEWLPGVHRDGAQEWADFGEGPQRPAVSTVLAKRPAAAPRIAALLRAGLLRLDPPGRAAPSEPPAPGTLPPPAPRLPAIRDLSQPQQPLALDLPAAIASIRPPRLRLDPGHAVANAAPLEPTPLPSFPAAEKPLDDPLFTIERRIAELEASAASGPERARAFAALADGWRGRYGSIERACRAFREAAAADPGDSAMLYQAAAHCQHMGDGELAKRYAVGAVAAAAIPIERAGAQLLLARIERSAGNVEACIEALCEAAADDPENPEPHEQVATLLLDRGQADGANAHIRLAATALDDDTNERALALLAWAFALKPGDAPTAYEYASLLDASGRRAGAVAVLTECAAHCLDHDQVRKLRLAAAERAESARRPDIAAETLVDAFDADPHFDLLYGPLDEDLQALGVPEYHAVVLEDIATACAEEQRAHWLTLAGKAMLRVEGQHEAGLRLLFEALLTAPRNGAALQALRVHAHSRAGLTLLAHGLRVAIAASIEDQSSDATSLLSELADLAETGLGNPHLAHAALTQLERLSPAEASPTIAARGARLQQQIGARQNELQAAERSLASAEGPTRAELCQRVAMLLPDLPDDWPRRIELLEAALAAGHAPATTREEIEGLLGLRRDVVGLATFLEDQADLTQDRAERVRLLTRLCELHAVREDIPAIAATCETLLAIDPSCRIAVAHLERAGRKLGEPGRLARALSLRSAWTVPGRPLARALAQLARAQEQAGSLDEAASRAAAALREDPTAADAGAVLVRHSQRVDPKVALLALQAQQAACGPSRVVLSLQARAAQACSDVAALRAAIETWVELLPSDGAAQRALIVLRSTGQDPVALAAAAQAALTKIPSAEVLEAATAALERLEALGAPEAAARLGLQLAEEQGRADPGLAERIAKLARLSGSRELVTQALELQVAFRQDARDNTGLLALAAHHGAGGEAAAEVRVLLRVLESDPRHRAALSRLRELFARGGDAPRLLAVLSLELDASPDLAARRSVLLELATVAGVRLHDLERAEQCVRRLVAENADELDTVRNALGILFSLTDPAASLSRCQAIAEGCSTELASRIYLWCAVTAEQRLQDPALALRIACEGALRWPSFAEPLLVVERLTLASRDVERAMQIYDALIAAACGPHGRRALLYRVGRWLEQAGLLDRALERYVAAFELAPTSGAAFKALQRVARQTSAVERIVLCHEQLAAHVHENRARVTLLCQAADICANELHDLTRSFALLLRANAFSERSELDARLLDLGLALRAQDAQAGTEALSRFAEQLEQRAAQLWNGEDKVRALMRLCTLCDAGLQDCEKALGFIEQAIAIVRNEELPQDLLAEASATRDAVVARMPARPESAVVVEAATPAEPAAAEPPAPAPRLPAPPPAPPPVPREPFLAASDAPQARQSPPPTPAAATPRKAPRPAFELEPLTAEHLRELTRSRADLGDPAEAYVLKQLVSCFDRRARVPVDAEFHSGLWRDHSLRDAIGAERPEGLPRLLALMWEYARLIPRFRNPLAAFGVSERDRISRITVGPVAEAYALAARTLDRTDVPVYVTTGGPAARPIATHPPSVLASRSASQDRAALQYGLAHALFLARDEHVIAGLLPLDDAAALLDAASQAFAPGATRERASSASKEIAAVLWQSVPTREQRALTQLLYDHRASLEYPKLRARTRALAARAALLASGGLRAALSALPTTEPELAGIDLRNEEDFDLACARSPAVAETVRSALSRPYLDALAQTLRTEGRSSRI